jgi:hypothetical protein
LAKYNASEIINNFVSQFVSLEVCNDVVNKATVAQKALAKLIDNVVPDGITTAKKVVNEKLGRLIDVEFAKSLVIAKPCLEEGFMDIAKAFCGDMIGASVQVCAERVGRLMECMEQFSSRSAHGNDGYYVYFVDEYTGVPVVGDEEIRVGRNESAMVTELMIGMRMTLKGVCGENSVEGLRKLVGLDAIDDLEAWKPLSQCTIGCWETVATQSEYSVFSEILRGKALEDGDVDKDLEGLEEFII